MHDTVRQWRSSIARACLAYEAFTIDSLGIGRRENDPQNRFKSQRRRLTRIRWVLVLAELTVLHTQPGLIGVKLNTDVVRHWIDTWHTSH